MGNKKQLGGKFGDLYKAQREKSKEKHAEKHALVSKQIEQKQIIRREEYIEEQARKEAIQTAKDAEQTRKDMESGDTGLKLALKKLMRNLGDLYQTVKGGFIGIIIVPILFASVAPALPLFVFMAGLFAVLKYFMGYLKKI